MRYVSFTIRRYKGINELTLDFTGEPASPIFVLVGLNESGKTTILEALSFFARNVIEADDVQVLLDRPQGDLHDLIPKTQQANFNGSIDISARIDLDDTDIEALRVVLQENAFPNPTIRRSLTVTQKFRFENSAYKEKKRHWGLDITGRQRTAPRNLALGPDHEAWTPTINALRARLPSIIYYPNFLFDFPNRIYLEPHANDAPEQGFYRRLLQDVLDSLNLDLNLETHVLQRAKSDAPEDKPALDSVLSKMGSQISRTVFAENLSVFRSDTRNKSIVVAEPKVDPATGTYYVEVKLKDGDDNYYIRERSLGFRWFFTFLLFTQFRRHRASAGNLIFLFDEPASNLHQTAQERLLKALADLTAQNDVSVIYSTHSHHLIDPKRLEATFIVRNLALNYDHDDVYSSSLTNIQVERYRTFVATYPELRTYYQPILDVLEYKPSNLEDVPEAAFVEGKNDFYTLQYFKEVVVGGNEPLALLAGTGSGSLDTAIQLYTAWGRQFVVVLDSDAAGERQKERYVESFGAIVRDRVFTLQDIDPTWADRELEDLLELADREAIQRSAYPQSGAYKKKTFNLAVQELLHGRKAVPISDVSRERFERIIGFLRNALRG